MQGPGGLPSCTRWQFDLFETNDLNLTTANFDSYGNVSFDPYEFTLHTAVNAENNDCSKKHVCFFSLDLKFLYFL
jgi:hypothetical protein